MCAWQSDTQIEGGPYPTQTPTNQQATNSRQLYALRCVKHIKQQTRERTQTVLHIRQGARWVSGLGQTPFCLNGREKQ